MSNEESTSPNREELLASQMGDPSGAPQAVEAKDPVLTLIGVFGIGAVVIGGLMVPMLASQQSCRGATRSTKVKWEQRQQQIERAEALQKSQSHE